MDGTGRTGGAPRRVGGRDEQPPAIPSSAGSSAVPPSSAAGSISALAQRKWVPPSSVNKSAGNLPATSEHHDAIFRKVRGILNKLTPEKFDKLSLELLNVGINSELVLRGIILLIFEKALDEAKYSSLYAQLCQRICEDAPNFEPHSSNVSTFKRLLLNKCQDEFENRSRATDLFDKDGPLSVEEEEQLSMARRKMLGNIKFIGELGKLEMLRESILHQCIKQLLAKKKQLSPADQAEDLECLAQIMRTVGKRLDQDKARLWMDQYFERIRKLADQPELPSRIRFMLQDVIELRSNNWRPRKILTEVKPKTIQEVHAEAAKEYMMMPGANPMAVNMNFGMGPPAMMGAGMDLFGPPHRPIMNGRGGGGGGGMADVFGPMSPPFLGSSTGIGTGPGTIPMDTFSSTFFPGGDKPRMQMQPQKQGYYDRKDRDNSHSPKQHRQKAGGMEGRSGSPRYDNGPRGKGGSPPNQRHQRYSNDNRSSYNNNNNRGGGQHQKGGHYHRSQAPSSQQGQPQQQQQQRELPPRFQRKLQQQGSGEHTPTAQQQNSGSFTPPFSESPRHGSPQPGYTGGQSSPHTAPHVSPQKSGEAPLGADLSGGEISLRPARNFAPLLKPNTPGYLPRSAQTPPQQQQQQPPFQSLRPRIMGPPGGGGEDPPSLLTTKAPQVTIRQVAGPQEKAKERKEKEKKGSNTEQLRESTERLLRNLLNGGEESEAVAAVREMRPPKRFLPQMVAQLLQLSLEREDNDRDRLSQLLATLHREGILSSDTFMQGFGRLLDDLVKLESTVPLVRSSVARFGAQAVQSEMVTLAELAEPMDHGRHYPLFFLCLQQLHKITDQKWLLSRFNDSKLDLLAMLPESDRQRERLTAVLEDRGLAFLFPLMRVQAELQRQMNADPSPQNLYKWVKDNVDTSLQTTKGFIDILTRSILKYVLEESTCPEGCDTSVAPEKAAMEKEKELLGRYKPMLLFSLQDNLGLQLTALYALQGLSHALAFPKGMILRMFMNLYDYEIIDEDAFLKWKEDINDEVPGKRTALFQVNQWLTWLEQAEDEDSEEEED